jgi:hypothetical protein
MVGEVQQRNYVVDVLRLPNLVVVSKTCMAMIMMSHHQSP